jgi:hypothetical protein
MSIYSFRYWGLKPVRMLVRLLSNVVRLVPGTTYGEAAEMHSGPCSRCVGRALEGRPTDQPAVGDPSETQPEVAY